MSVESALPGLTYGHGLSAQEQVFVREYVATGNQTRAAREAWGIAEPRTANMYARRALSRQVIKDKLAELGRPILEAQQVTAQRVMLELARIAFADVRSLYDANGNLLPVHLLDDDTAAAVASIEAETTMRGKGDQATPVTTIKVKRADKVAALNMLARHFRIIGEVGEGVDALAGALADRLNAARKRVLPADVSEVTPPGVGEGPSRERGAIPRLGPPSDQICEENPKSEINLQKTASPAAVRGTEIADGQLADGSTEIADGQLADGSTEIADGQLADNSPQFSASDRLPSGQTLADFEAIDSQPPVPVNPFTGRPFPGPPAPAPRPQTVSRLIKQEAVRESRKKPKIVSHLMDWEDIPTFLPDVRKLDTPPQDPAQSRASPQEPDDEEQLW